MADPFDPLRPTEEEKGRPEMRGFQDPSKHLQTSTIPLAFQQQHQQSELRVDWNTSNYFLDNSAQGTEYYHLDRPQRQRVPSALTQADGCVSRSSLHLSTLLPSDQLPAALDDLSRHPPIPSNDPSSDPNVMGEMTYSKHMTRYSLEYSMEAFDPSTFPGLPQAYLSSDTVELSFRHEDNLPYSPCCLVVWDIYAILINRNSHPSKDRRYCRPPLDPRNPSVTSLLNKC